MLSDLGEDLQAVLASDGNVGALLYSYSIATPGFQRAYHQPFLFVRWQRWCSSSGEQSVR